MNLTLSTKLKIKISHVLWIGLVWGIFGLLDSIITWCISKSYYLDANQFYNPRFDTIYTAIGFFIGGIAAASLVLFVFKDRWSSKPFWMSFLFSTLIILLFHNILCWVAYLHRFSFGYGKPFNDEQVLSSAFNYLTGPPHLGNTIVIMLLTTGTILWVRVNQRYGPGYLISSFIGKYHLPIEEQRIFMFLDLKSSTSIAEILGHIRFYQFLNDFFHDIGNPILYSKGEVYQYVGDEAVVSWKLKNGIENGNCIQCFYEIKNVIAKKAKYYEKQYGGIVPEFKAGIHVGPVTTGEIGDIKRDLVHTGDVLNTTARIQAKCNELNSPILISEDLLKQLTLMPAHLIVRARGKHILRGKKRHSKSIYFCRKKI